MDNPIQRLRRFHHRQSPPGTPHTTHRHLPRPRRPPHRPRTLHRHLRPGHHPRLQFQPPKPERETTLSIPEPIAVTLNEEWQDLAWKLGNNNNRRYSVDTKTTQSAKHRPSKLRYDLEKQLDKSLQATEVYRCLRQLALLAGGEETIQSLQDELGQARDMSNMAEQFSQAMMQAAGEDGGEALQAKIDEILEEKNQRIAEVKQENGALRDDLHEVTERANAAEERAEELERYENPVANLSELREAVQGVGETLDMGFDGEPDERLRERLEQREERVEELEAEVDRLEHRLESSEAPLTVATDYEAFVEEDVVQDAIEEAKEKSSASQRYVSGVVAAIIQDGGPVDDATITEHLAVSTTSDVSKASSTLEALGVVKKVEERPGKIDFDMESVAEIIEKLRRRRQAKDMMEGL